MNTQTRIIITLAILTIAISVSFFLNSEHAETTSQFNVDLSYKTVSSNKPLVKVEQYGQVQQGSFFLQQENQQGYLLSPLLDTKVDMTVTGLIARAIVTQEFTNSTTEWVNGIYAFPLPENAAVDHLTMKIGERTIVGKIQPKQKARKLYQQAKSAGKKASLLVQNRPNLFTNHVANIGPGETISVTIEYQQAITFDKNLFSLRFPTTITQRYLPSSPLSSEQKSIDENGWGNTQPTFENNTVDASKEGAPPMHKLAMNITLNSGFELEKIESEQHPIITNKMATGQYNVQLEQDMIANQDFVLQWQAKPTNQPTAAHFSQATENGHYGMIMLMPPQLTNKTTPLNRDVVFVIDTSGSMAGTSMKQAKNALAWAISDLSSTDTFNVIAFNSTANKVFQQSMPANNANKSTARKYIDQLNANGGTEILSALQLSLGHQTPNPTHIRQVVFITDGAVGNEAELFSYINKHLNQSRLFTVGIGSAPNSYFMTEAALMGKGTYTYVSSVDTVQTKMQQLFGKLKQPVLANLTAQLNQEVDMYPRQLPDLYQGEPIMLSYFSKQAPEQMLISGKLRQQDWQQTLALQHSGQQSGLSTLWARRKIAHLSREKYKGQDATTINKQILAIAMEHHLVSEMTSLIAVDMTPSAKAKSIDSAIKNQRPKGQQGMLPQTATPASLQALIALFFLILALGVNLLNKKRQ
ncbi:marine proteobacterial sortase target protein [Thalassotalea sp. 1_MG-2023]|uniref:marine proteobacterial sortase target protein n=1 Tax=Thalassotalea sp. 1_MG-2023 TaxID=3062680 RepID=UPI0026E44BB2|nr:marine proteobacterial sortase target protein [Thalassotalea sp. 1_MG-2023]MDO6427931.1 marine proteobacterial sortase target protein [Thalassotalea sp. 1_MG-2023]